MIEYFYGYFYREIERTAFVARNVTGETRKGNGIEPERDRILGKRSARSERVSRNYACQIFRRIFRLAARSRGLITPTRRRAVSRL